MIVQGEVAAVSQAVESAVQSAILKPAAYAVIANPHEELWKIIKLSQKKLHKTEQSEKVEDKTMSEV